ncbi:MAG: hypothetical protein AAF569_03020 [Pseudomonadota bacterium]
MLRFVLVAAFFALVFMPLSIQAESQECPQCKGVYDVYKHAQSQHKGAKNRLADAEDRLERYNNDVKKAGRDNSQYSYRPIEGLSAEAEAKAAQNLIEMMEVREVLQDEVNTWRKRVAEAEDFLKEMNDKGAACQKHCRAGDQAHIVDDMSFGGDKSPFPYQFNGPYETTCPKCQALADKLNSYPEEMKWILGMIYLERSVIEHAERKKKLLKATESPKLSLPYMDEVDEDAVMDYGDLSSKPMTDEGVAEKHAAERRLRKEKRKKLEDENFKAIKGDKEAVERVNELVSMYDQNIRYAKERMNEWEGKKIALIKQVKATEDAFNDCIKNCKPATASKQACAFPDTVPAITIGANSEVGSGAEFTNAVKDQAKGVAMGALNNALGGSGLSLGGGGGSKSNEPKEVRDPTRSADFTNISSGGAEVGFRSILNGNELTVSSEIQNAPGKGTFHAQWLEDGAGNVYLPKEYMIFELYQDWKLTVWWDYKRWRDGQLVEHRHGEEVSFGRNTKRLAAWYEGPENAAWSILGFGTATGGAKGIGAKFVLPDSVLAADCPVRLVTLISEPKKDPVSTIPLLADIPMLGSAFKGKPASQRQNLIIQVTPTLATAE